MRVFKILLYCALILLVATELILRFSFGFCDAVLYQSNDKYEYISQPNQNRHRFGVNIRTNSFCQRSDEPDTNKRIILGLGDSIIYGGNQIDNDSLATSIATDDATQYLNISAGSWSPDNCAGYLSVYGTFNAIGMILVCSSHDAYDSMSNAPVVGVFSNYPDKQYTFAIVELLERYVIPLYIDPLFKDNDLSHDPDQQVVMNNPIPEVAQKSDFFSPGLQQRLDMSSTNNTPIVVYLHAERNEIEAGQYNWMGKKIEKLCEEKGIPLVKGLDNGENLSMYRDIIHFNESGQRFLATQLKKIEKEYFPLCPE